MANRERERNEARIRQRDRKKERWKVVEGIKVKKDRDTKYYIERETKTWLNIANRQRKLKSELDREKEMKSGGSLCRVHLLRKYLKAKSVEAKGRKEKWRLISRHGPWPDKNIFQRLLGSGKKHLPQRREHEKSKQFSESFLEPTSLINFIVA